MRAFLTKKDCLLRLLALKNNFIIMKKNKYSFSVFLFLISIVYSFGQCNGSVDLCQKKYNQVAYLTTHNAFNSADNGFSLPNQNLNIMAQLNDGVRALMLDVYDDKNTPITYHGYKILGSKPFIEFLKTIKIFLDTNPKEVITVILECYTSANSIENSINETGLSKYLYTHILNTDWPSLQSMINDNKRLVFFSDKEDASPTQGWYHYMWKYAVETSYSAKSINDLNCSFNRGNASNDLFILNHFITSSIGVGVKEKANSANSNPYFMNRVLQCQKETNKFPNFITVDFYDLGNGFEVVNQINK